MGLSEAVLDLFESSQDFLVEPNHFGVPLSIEPFLVRLWLEADQFKPAEWEI